jgi:hypothetical protein
VYRKTKCFPVLFTEKNFLCWGDIWVHCAGHLSDLPALLPPRPAARGVQEVRRQLFVFNVVNKAYRTILQCIVFRPPWRTDLILSFTGCILYLGRMDTVDNMRQIFQLDKRNGNVIIFVNFLSNIPEYSLVRFPPNNPALNQNSQVRVFSITPFEFEALFDKSGLLAVSIRLLTWKMKLFQPVYLGTVEKFVRNKNLKLKNLVTWTL